MTLFVFEPLPEIAAIEMVLEAVVMGGSELLVVVVHLTCCISSSMFMPLHRTVF